jgi:DNA helicase HerA-like ATPase
MSSSEASLRVVVEDLPFSRVLSTPMLTEAEHDSRPDQALLAGVLDAGVRRRSVAGLWCRQRAGGPLDILIAGATVGPRAETRDGEPLAFPVGTRGYALSQEQLRAKLKTFELWLPCVGLADPLVEEEELSRRGRGAVESMPVPPLDETVGYLAEEAFAWLVLCEPRTEETVQSDLEQLRREAFQLRQLGERSEADRLEAERRHTLFRKLALAGPGGSWNTRILVGVPKPPDSPDQAAATAGSIGALLCSAAERSIDGYRLRISEGLPALSLEQIPADTPLDHGIGSFPFAATADLVAALVRAPAIELPGIRMVRRPSFDTTPEEVDGETDASTVTLGRVLDRNLRPAGVFGVELSTLNRHTFVCGATGAGKSQTVRGLLEGLSRRDPRPIPWLVVEPAKAEYRRMAPRIADVSQVLAIAPGSRHAPPASLNPLEPASLEPGNPDRTFPLQSHADLVRALFLAAFRADEPLPQVIARSLTTCYEETGWDLVTGAALPQWAGEERKGSGATDQPVSLPRYPRLGDLQRTAQRIVGEIGYGEQMMRDVRGFVDVRIGSLRLGTPGRFFEGGHPLDFAAILQRNVVFEIENVTNDQDKAFLMGVVLIRLYEQLQLEEKRRFEQDKGAPPFRHVTVIEEAHRLLRNVEPGSPAAYAVELFANLLAEVRAYGEGVVIADQIPSKLIPDAIKNTALKVVHRLPAADDRATVGATMNLSEAQSEYVVTLRPGRAAVFADGMDRPVLVSMNHGEDREHSDVGAVEIPPVTTRRSRACSEICYGEEACNLSEIREAELTTRAFPELGVWVEVACVFHLSGLRPPQFCDTPTLGRIRALSQRLVGCAIAHRVEETVATRYTALKDFYDPEALASHLGAAARHAVFPNDVDDPCPKEGGRWRAGVYRLKDIEQDLEKLDGLSQQARRGIATKAAERGLTLIGETPSDQLAFIRSLRWSRLSDEENQRILFGTSTPPHLLTTAAAAAGPGTAEQQLTTATGLFLWQTDKEKEKRDWLIKAVLPTPITDA